MAAVYMFFTLVCFVFISHVKIFAEFDNVALHKKAYQSSYYSDEHFSQRSASLAVDGETKEHDDNYIHTAVDQPYTWWEVDLGKLYFVHEVKIYFRAGFEWRRRGVQIYTNTAVNSSNTGHLCGTESDINDVLTFMCNVNARYVTVYQGTDHGRICGTALHFVEVEVYACELNVKYGSDCEKLCKKRHCVNTHSPCDVQRGKCDTAGCTAGWTGTDCKEACELNVKYGSNCDKLCEKRHCVNTHSPCDVQTGKCDTAGCKAGWNGTDCTQGCSPGKYGVGCHQSCVDRHCFGNQTCDASTGTCIDGCVVGWQGVSCNKLVSLLQICIFHLRSLLSDLLQYNAGLRENQQN